MKNKIANITLQILSGLYFTMLPLMMYDLIFGGAGGDSHFAFRRPRLLLWLFGVSLVAVVVRLKTQETTTPYKVGVLLNLVVVWFVFDSTGL